jgi:hypothetical protein
MIDEGTAAARRMVARHAHDDTDRDALLAVLRLDDDRGEGACHRECHDGQETGDIRG